MRRPSHRSSRAARHRVHPGQQFVQVERLDQVVVGTGLQAADAVADLVARGQHDHRPGQPARPPVAQQVQAVAVGQLQVQQRQCPGRGGTRLGDAARPLHPVAGGHQMVDHRLAEVVVVFEQ